MSGIGSGTKNREANEGKAWGISDSKLPNSHRLFQTFLRPAHGITISP
jgi:hypothetical protein